MALSKKRKWWIGISIAVGILSIIAVLALVYISKQNDVDWSQILHPIKRPPILPPPIIGPKFLW